MVDGVSEKCIEKTNNLGVVLALNSNYAVRHSIFLRFFFIERQMNIIVNWSTANNV